MEPPKRKAGPQDRSSENFQVKRRRARSVSRWIVQPMDDPEKSMKNARKDERRRKKEAQVLLSQSGHGASIMKDSRRRGRGAQEELKVTKERLRISEERIRDLENQVHDLESKLHDAMAGGQQFVSGLPKREATPRTEKQIVNGGTIIGDVRTFSSELMLDDWAAKFDQCMEQLLSRPEAGQKFYHEVKADDFTWEDSMMLAIASVIEAEGPNRTNPFSITTPEAINTAKTGAEFDPENGGFARCTGTFLLPIVKSSHSTREEAQDAPISGLDPRSNHNILIIFEITDGGEVKRSWVDSAPDVLAPRCGEIIIEIMELMERLPWGRRRLEDPLPQLAGGFNWLKTPRQTERETCGIHTIINGWVAALGLEINNKLDATGDKFAERGAKLINCAMLGLVDCDTIYAFLRASDYIKPTEIPESLRFDRTRRVVTEGELNELVAVAQAIEESKAYEEHTDWASLGIGGEGMIQ
ncbi:MAG: hypothetical protein Q9157_000566 [Trypethelium eluteriae]